MKRFRDTDYFITENGEVWSEKSGELKKRKPQLDKDGYVKIGLFINKKDHKFRIHRLVAEVYIPNPNNYPQVNHIDGNKTNNYISNLEWCDQSMNNSHKIKVLGEGLGETHGRSKLTEEQVKYIREVYIPRHKEYGVRALARKFNVCNASISYIINNKNWKHI